MNSQTNLVSTGALYEIREGRHGTGMFCRGAIAKYQQILCEQPVLFVPNAFALLAEDPKVIKFMQSYPLNDALMKANCMELELYVVCHFLLQSRTDDRTRTLFEKLTIGPQFRASASDETFVPAIARITGYTKEQVRSATGKVYTNVFGVSANLLESSLGYAIYNDASFINHSCDPNSMAFYKADGSVIFVATRDIAAGEEIRWCYIKRLPHLVNDRRANLKRMQHFTCTCDLCVEQEMSQPSFEDCPLALGGEASVPASVSSFGKMMTSVLNFVNEILASCTTARLQINKEALFDVKKSARLFFRLCGTVVPSYPRAFPFTHLLVEVLGQANAILEDKNFKTKRAVFQVAFSTLLREDELSALPIKISKMLLEQSLCFAILSSGEFSPHYGAFVERLVMSGTLDFATMTCVQSFASKLLGKRLDPSVCIIEPQLSQARTASPSAFFEVDAFCSPMLEDILEKNNRATEFFLHACRERARNPDRTSANEAAEDTSKKLVSTSSKGESSPKSTTTMTSDACAGS